MTTPTGTISLNDVNVELGKSGTTTIALNNSDVRTLAGVSSGTISMDNLRGKSNRVSISYTFGSHSANASLNLSAIGGYLSGKSDITVTINGGVYVYSTTTGGYALNIYGGTTGDTLTIVNNGYIIGQGGNGGKGKSSGGQSGGPALNLGFGMSSCTINNTNGSAYIAGGGGGGGGGNQNSTGGGGGGGAGGGGGGQDSNNYNGGSGGGIGSAGSRGLYYDGGGGGGGAGGGGGRQLPGSGGSGDYWGGFGGGAGGGGGGGYYYYSKNSQAFTGGNGGSSNGGGSSPNTAGGGGGGGWGASGGGSYYGAGGGGKAINTNGKSISWVSGNTSRVYGSVS